MKSVHKRLVIRAEIYLRYIRIHYIITNIICSREIHLNSGICICPWNRIQLAPCDTRVPARAAWAPVSKGQRLRCRRVDQIQYVPLSRRCHCMGEQRRGRHTPVYSTRYIHVLPSTVLFASMPRSALAAVAAVDVAVDAAAAAVDALVVVLAVGFRKPKSSTAASTASYPVLSRRSLVPRS